MSYSIIYNKQFVKLSNGTIIPMILAGDNNVYEVSYTRNGRQRRSRSWHTIYLSENGIVSVTPEKLLRIIDDEIKHYTDRCDSDEWYIKNKYTKEYVCENFGYMTGLYLSTSGRKLTAKQYRSYFEFGIKNAKTIKELSDIGVHLKFNVFRFGNPEFSIPIPENSENYIKTEEEFNSRYSALIEWAKTSQYREHKTDKWEKPSIYLTFSGQWEPVLNNLTKSRKKTFKSPEYIQVDKFYALENESGFLKRYVKRGYKYTHYQQGCKVFKNYESANAYRDKLIRDEKYQANTWTIKEVHEKISIKK